MIRGKLTNLVNRVKDYLSESEPALDAESKDFKEVPTDKIKKVNERKDEISKDEKTEDKDRSSPEKPFPDFLGAAISKIADAVNKTSSDILSASENKTNEELRETLSKIKVVAFIGSSGTGKSTRAIKVAKDNNIHFLIDDGLLINGGAIVSGLSAKKANSRLESVRQALFMDESRAMVMRRALAENSPQKLMILGTSDGMLERICDKLWLNRPSEIIRIEDVTTEEERRTAVLVRSTQGRHTIPVPSMEIKHEFSGYFADPINKLLRKKDRGGDLMTGYAGSDRTVIRPTFSTLGKYSISSNALADIASIVMKTQVKGSGDILNFNAENQNYGVVINMDISIRYGFSAPDILREVQSKVASSIEDLTAMNVVMVNVSAKRVVRA